MKYAPRTNLISYIFKSIKTSVIQIYSHKWANILYLDIVDFGKTSMTSFEELSPRPHSCCSINSLYDCWREKKLVS